MMQSFINQTTIRLLPRGGGKRVGAQRAVCPLGILLLAALLLASCLDETLLSTTYGQSPTATDDADMYLSIDVPRTTFSSGPAAGKENEVQTLDVMVFAKGIADPENYYVHAACKGTLTDPTDNKFQVVMPVGKGFIVHVFANCHEAMAARNFYNSRGREMNAMLADLTEGTNVNDDTATALPMHGYRAGVTIDKSMANTALQVPVLRTVAAVQVMTKVTDNADGSYTPGDVTDEKGQPNFALRELYLYFYPDSGRMAAKAESYEAPKPDETVDQTRDVTTVSLPEHHRVSNTRMTPDDPDKPDLEPYHIISADPVSQLGCLYLYENKPYSPDGFDQPAESTPVATSRLVVGGVYNGETEADGQTPKVTYYRVDFTNADNDLTEVLRNHKYTFSIESVSGSGYDTPDDAATGVPINIYVKVIDWTNDLEHVDFDRQNYFYSEAKQIVLPRNKDAVRSIAVKSDVKVANWKMNFKTDTNGATIPVTVANDGKVTPTQEAALSNNRYKVEKSADGLSLKFTALKAYSDLPVGESLTETLIVKANELEITYLITQVDKSPDDWGNGGENDSEVGGKGEEGKIDGVEVGDWGSGNETGTPKLDTELDK